MCAYLHILFRPKIRPNTPNTNLKCQENACFCICVCAGTDMWKMDKNKPKTDKNEHEIGKRSIAEAEEEIYPRKAQNDKSNP